MEAWLATLGLGIVMVLGLAVLLRTWPRGQGRAGYHTWTESRERDDLDLAGERGEVPREDDEVHWTGT